MFRTSLSRMLPTLLCLAAVCLTCPVAEADPGRGRVPFAWPVLVTGTISSVDATAGTVTFTLSSGKTLTVNVSPTTRIVVQGSGSQTLQDLATAVQTAADNGQPAYVGAALVDSLDTLNALWIGATNKKPKPAKPTFVKGTVTSVDVSAGTVTFTPWTGDPVTVNVSSSTQIEINDVNGKTLKDLATAVQAAADNSQPAYSGVARVDSLDSLNALRIGVSNIPDDDD